jgi:hypothetical protein
MSRSPRTHRWPNFMEFLSTYKPEGYTCIGYRDDELQAKRFCGRCITEKSKTRVGTLLPLLSGTPPLESEVEAKDKFCETLKSLAKSVICNLPKVDPLHWERQWRELTDSWFVDIYKRKPMDGEIYSPKRPRSSSSLRPREEPSPSRKSRSATPVGAQVRQRRPNNIERHLSINQAPRNHQSQTDPHSSINPVTAHCPDLNESRAQSQTFGSTTTWNFSYNDIQAVLSWIQYFLQLIWGLVVFLVKNVCFVLHALFLEGMWNTTGYNGNEAF